MVALLYFVSHGPHRLGKLQRKKRKTDRTAFIVLDGATLATTARFEKRVEHITSGDVSASSVPRYD